MKQDSVGTVRCVDMCKNNIRIVVVTWLIRRASGRTWEEQSLTECNQEFKVSPKWPDPNAVNHDFFSFKYGAEKND